MSMLELYIRRTSSRHDECVANVHTQITATCVSKTAHSLHPIKMQQELSS